MNVLLLCDDLWHPGEVIVRGLRPLTERGYRLDVVMAPKDILTRDMLDEYDVIICARGNAHSPANTSAPWFEPEVTAVMPEDFKDYVENGGGYIALHSGNTYSRKYCAAMANLIGNDFIGHPRQCTVTAKPVGKHPITEGVGEFSFRDEHYMIDCFAQDADVFLETSSDSEAGTQTAGYTRSIGNGRLCVLTPGHNCAVLKNESYLKLIENALNWCAGKK